MGYENEWLDNYPTYGSTDLEVVRRTGCEEMLEKYAVVKFDAFKDTEDYTEDETVIIQHFVQLARSFLAITDTPFLFYGGFYGRPLFSTYRWQDLKGGSSCDTSSDLPSSSAIRFLSNISYELLGNRRLTMLYGGTPVREIDLLLGEIKATCEEKNIQFEKTVELLSNTCYEFICGPVEESSFGIVDCIEDTCPLEKDTPPSKEALIYEHRLRILYHRALDALCLNGEFRRLEKVIRTPNGLRGGYDEHIKQLDFHGDHYRDKANSTPCNHSAGIYKTVSDLVYTKADHLRIKMGRPIKHTGIDAYCTKKIDKDYPPRSLPIPLNKREFLNNEKVIMPPYVNDVMLDPPTPFVLVSC